MPHVWALVDSSFPTFTENERSSRKIEKLVDYMKILVEALQYQLENLDTENWNAAALETFQLDTTADVEEQMETLAQKIAALAGEVSKLNTQVNGSAGLSLQVQQIGEALDGLRESMQKDADGNVTIGQEGKELRLVGTVYVNGKILE